MTSQTMGELIAARRKEKGMTQKDLADKLHITDKAVSKWERDLACPDVNTIPKLAELLDVSLEELMTATPKERSAQHKTDDLIRLILKAVPLAMGIAVTVTALLGELDVKSGFSMLGIGLICLAASLWMPAK